jgi:hypothetical protein
LPQPCCGYVVCKTTKRSWWPRATASTPPLGKGKQEIRLAYVLETSKLERAGQLLLLALDRYKKECMD